VNQPGHGAQQRALADAVRSDEPDAMAGVELQLDIIEDQAWTKRDGQRSGVK
jgi:hypothetical protein